MRFSASQIAEAYRFYARRRKIDGEPNAVAIEAALKVVEDLAPAERDEPAALLYAFARFPRAFPGAFRAMTQHVARTRAQMLGYQLRLSAEEFDRAIFAVTEKRATYEQIRDWMARKLERP